MEQENIQPVFEQNNIKSSLTNVTPLSKYFAMALFIALPFIGGWVGYTYAPDKVVEVEKVIIKEIQVNEDVVNVETPTSADNAPEGSIHNLPVPEAVTAVKMRVASELSIDPGIVIPMSVYEKDWSDSCLGLGGPAESCLMAITPGYEITVLAQGNEKVFRTNLEGTVIREQK